MSFFKHPIVQAALLLAAFAMVGATLVASTHHLTAEKIRENHRHALLKNLYALVPSDTIDNAIDKDSVIVNNPLWLGSDSTQVYLGFKQQQPIAAVYTSLVTNGYSGNIRLLVAVKQDATLGGVRIIEHKETPGLGDKIELKRSPWVLGFNHKSLSNPSEKNWSVKRDGGKFDQFTGATITPRAIVAGVKKTLIYHREYGKTLFANYLKTHQLKGNKHE